jgi:uncharacterized protein YodC (DUF2158 family)
MANLFNKGNVVVMKSGGPPMTVDKVPGDYLHRHSTEPMDEYRCEWFKGASPLQGQFGEHLLEAYTPPKK